MKKYALALGIFAGSVLVTSASFTALTAFADSTGALISVSAAVAAPHAPATISGSGFNAGETVHLTFGADSKDVVASGSGTISTTMNIPAVPSGLYFVGGFGETSGHWALGYLWVAGFSPTVSPSSWYINPGTPLTFSGSGFAPNESVTFSYNGTTIASTTADAFGNISGVGPVTLPFSLHNTVANVVVRGSVSNTPTTAGITIGQLYPSITPSTWYTTPGTLITVAGSGFAPNESVAITAGASSATTSTNTLGDFSLSNFKLPTTGGITATLIATGATSGASASVGIILTAYSPWITLSTYWAQGGSALTIFGNGFSPGESVTYTSGSSTLATTVAGSDGSLILPTVAPFAPAGPATLTLKGSTSNTPASATMTIAPVYTDLQLKNYAGAPGTAVEFIGHGYLPNEPLQLTTDKTGSSIVATWSADATGSFDFSGFTASSLSCGPANLTVTGTHSFDVKTVGYYVTGC